MATHDAPTGVAPSEELPQDWVVWQLTDSLLPVGAFAHSSGLESALQAGLIASNRHLCAYIETVLENTTSLLLPFVYAAHQNAAAFKEEEGEEGGKEAVERWVELDGLLHAMMTNHVGRKASQSLGASLLRVAAQLFPEAQMVAKVRRKSKAAKVHLHQAPLFGTICGALGLPSQTTLRIFLFTTLRDVLSAATRLNVVGPLEAATCQRQLAVKAEELLREGRGRREVGEACGVAPIMELVQGGHDRLFSKLFSS